MRRGCRKPGMDYEMAGGMPFVYTSPALQSDEDRILRECPVGRILRETPHVFEAIEASAYVDNAGPRDARHIPPYLHQVWRIVSSERQRLHELKMSEAKGRRDVDIGKRVRGG